MVEVVGSTRSCCWLCLPPLQRRSASARSSVVRTGCELQLLGLAATFPCYARSLRAQRGTRMGEIVARARRYFGQSEMARKGPSMPRCARFWQSIQRASGFRYEVMRIAVRTSGAETSERHYSIVTKLGGPPQRVK